MGLFSFLSGHKESKEPCIELGSLEVDMHSHLIPGIDDGSPDIETSISLIEEFKALGFRKLITTPHINGDYYKNTPEIISTNFEHLVNEVKTRNIDIELEFAAEYMLDHVFSDLVANRNLLLLGKKYVLVELSYFNPPPHIYEVIFELQVAGYKVILAHPERYSYWHQNMSVYEDLKNRDVYFQVNLVSLSNFYGKQVQHAAQKLIDSGMIEFAGSDVHNNNYMAAYKKCIEDKWCRQLFHSGKILNPKL